MHTRIKLIRKTLNLTQSQFGKKLGVSKNVIYNLEKNKISIKDVFINHLCSVFKINKEWLLTGSGDMFLVIDNNSELESIMQKILNENDEFMKKIIFTFYPLTTEEREVISNLLNRLSSFSEKK